MLLLTGSSSASFFSGRSSLFNSFSPCFPFSRRCRCLASSIWSSLCFPVQIQIASHIGLSCSAGSAALIHLHCKARSSLRVRAAAAAAAECSLPRLPAHAHLIWVEILCWSVRTNKEFLCRGLQIIPWSPNLNYQFATVNLFLDPYAKSCMKYVPMHMPQIIVVLFLDLLIWIINSQPLICYQYRYVPDRIVASFPLSRISDFSFLTPILV